MRLFYPLFRLLPALLLLLLSACEDLTDPEVDIPAYITIEEIQLDITEPEQGTAASNFQDAWVYIDDRLIGIFQLPATFPVLETGAHKVSVRAGIFNSGISNNRVRYPFLDFYNIDTVLNAREVVVLHPKVRYFPETIFDTPWSGENFESGVNFEYSDNSDTTFVRVTNANDVFEGQASGLAYLESGDDYFEAYSPDITGIPKAGSPTFMEMHYKADTDFSIRAYFNDRQDGGDVIFLRARDEWTKIYIDLTDVVSFNPTATNYNFGLRVLKPGSNTASLYIDNVKFVHY